MRSLQRCFEVGRDKNGQQGGLPTSVMYVSSARFHGRAACQSNFDDLVPPAALLLEAAALPLGLPPFQPHLQLLTTSLACRGSNHMRLDEVPAVAMLRNGRMHPHCLLTIDYMSYVNAGGGATGAWRA